MPDYGYEIQLGIDTVDPVTEQFDCIDESLALAEEIIDGNGMKGTRSRALERTAEGIRRVGGGLVLEPTANEWALLLPWILGGTPSGTNYPLAEALSSRYVNIDRGSRRFTYSGCLVNRATFRSSEGEVLTVDLDIIGVDESVSATAFPTITLNTDKRFYFHNLSLTVGGTGYNAKDFELVVDNAVDSDRFHNSQTLSTDANARDRIITVSTMLPYSDAVAVYASGEAGVAIVATFTNGTVSLALSLGKVVFPRESPTQRGRDEILLPVRGQAYESGGTAELVTTLDNTP